MLKRHGIIHFQRNVAAKNGTLCKQWQILETHRDAARKLILGKGA